MKKYRVLFLCRANSARSIIAEALLRELGGGKFEAFSAGVEPAATPHPLALAQLNFTVDDIDKLSAKSWSQFTTTDAPHMDAIVSLCEETGQANAPAFPGSPVFCHWNFPDPLAETGSVDDQRREFERVFRQLLRRISVFTALPFESMKPSEQVTKVDAMDDVKSLVGPMV